MKANSKNGWWLVNLVFETENEDREYDWQIAELRMSVSTRCEHWREAFWKARRFGIDLERSEKGMKWIGVYSLAPIDSANEDLSIISTIKLITRTASEIMDSCISEYDLAEAAEEKRHKKSLNPDELDSDEAGF